MTILALDDDASIVDFLTRCLRYRGHDVSGTVSALEARRILRNQPVDLLITDIFMPEIDGLEIIQDLRNQPDRPIIIAISGGAMDPRHDFFLDCAHKLGADAVLRKPFEIDELFALVDSFQPQTSPHHESA